MEAGFFQHRSAHAGGPSGAARRIRPAEGAGASQPRRESRMTRPFQGVRILDFTQGLAGPYGSSQLALLAPEVVNVDRTEGEHRPRARLSGFWAERGMAPSKASW